MNECSICALDNLEEVEAASASALRQKGLWAGLGRRFNVNRQSLQNHMERHWVAPVTATESALAGLDAAIAQNIEELLHQMSAAPPELKPLYAVAIQNLQDLAQTKPSQQNLIAALKGIHEITGMKMEQRLMLEFGKHMFTSIGAPDIAGELSDPNIIDAELVD